MNTYTPSSNKVVHHTYTDLSNRQIGRPVHIVQYDDGIPILAVKLYNDGQEHTIPTNADANIRLEKVDGNFVYNPALGVDSDKSTVYFEVTRQMAVLPGEVNAVVELAIGNESVGTGSIQIVIDRNPIQQRSIESSTEYITAKQYAEQAKSSASAASSSQSAAKTSATNAANSATQAKNSQTAAKRSETNAQSYATQAKNSQTAAKTSETNAATSAKNAKASETSAKTAENNAKSYANQAESALQEILGADIGNFGSQLAMEHSVTQTLFDSNGNLLLDSNGNNLESQTIFADAGDIISIKKSITVLEYLVQKLTEHALLDSL